MADESTDEPTLLFQPTLCTYSRAEESAYVYRDGGLLIRHPTCPLTLPADCASACPCKRVASVDLNRGGQPVCVSVCLFPQTTTGQKVRSVEALADWVLRKKQKRSRLATWPTRPGWSPATTQPREMTPEHKEHGPMTGFSVIGIDWPLRVKGCNKKMKQQAQRALQALDVAKRAQLLALWSGRGTGPVLWDFFEEHGIPHPVLPALYVGQGHPSGPVYVDGEPRNRHEHDWIDDEAEPQRARPANNV